MKGNSISIRNINFKATKYFFSDTIFVFAEGCYITTCFKENIIVK